jgi:hypothetical protein
MESIGSIYKSLPLDSVLSYLNPDRSSTPYYFDIKFHIILPSTIRLREWSLSSCSLLQNFCIAYIFHLFHALYMHCPSHAHSLIVTTFGEEYKL